MELVTMVGVGGDPGYNTFTWDGGYDGHRRMNSVASRFWTSGQAETTISSLALTHDNNGNMTTNERDYRFEYDTENRLTVIRDSSNNVLATFTYDALGRRTSETRDGVTTLFYYNRDNVVLEYNLADPATPLRYHIQG